MKATNIRLITASAGSGKTYRLTGELSELLDEKTGNYYQPSQIIATTFTRAAASELRNRVREKVLEQGAYEIASLLDQSLVGTVNSISDQLLSLFAFDIGLSPVQRVVEDEEKDILFQKSLAIALDEDTLEKLDTVAERLYKQRSHINKLIQSIVDIARSNGIDDDGLHGSREDSIESMRCQLPKPTQDFKKIKATLSKEIPPIRAQVGRVHDTTKKTEECLKVLEGFLYLLHNELPVPWAQWAVVAELEPGQKSVKAGLFDNVKKFAGAHLAIPEFQQDLFDCIRICFDAAIKSLKNYRDLKNQRGLLDFIDQEAYLIEALDNPQVKKRFQELFKVLMVDEFQDTNPMQLSLFVKMASLVEKVVWVGDPKQSIYGFRGSDAALVDAVIQKLGKPIPGDILKDSFRSRPELVQIVNDFFVQAFKSKQDSITKEQIFLHAKRQKNERFQTAFQLWNFEWEGKGPNNLELYYSQVASRVLSFLQESPIVEDPDDKKIRTAAPGDIAILCRTNNECRDIANALRNIGLQAVVSNTGINTTAEWRFLRACLHVLVDETDSLAKAEIIFLNQHDHEIQALLDERLEFLHDAGDDYAKRNNWQPRDVVVAWISKNRSRLLAESVNGMIQLIYAGLQLHNKVMEWGNGAQRQANLQQIVEYAREFEDHCLKLGLLPNVHGFLSWFDDLAENEQDKRGLVTNQLSVNVLTYHAAKGLEWPVVMLTGLDRKHEPDVFAVRIKGMDKIDFDEPLKGRSIRFWPWPYKVGMFGAKSGYKKFKEACENTDDYGNIAGKQDLEALRLLYVGFTRARDYLVLPYKEKRLEWLESLIPDGIEALTGKSSGAIDTVIKKNKFFDGPFRFWRTVYNDFASQPENTPREVSIYPVRNLKSFPPYFINPSAAEEVPEYSFNEAAAVGDAIQTNGLLIEEKSTFGSLIHHFMCAFRLDMTDQQAKALIRSLAKNYGLSVDALENELAVQARQFHKWIETTFQPRRIHRELPLMMEKGGQLINGIADLVIENENEVVLIDYKTFAGDEAALQFKARSFSGQLAIYAEVLRKYFVGREVRTGVYFVMEGRMIWMEERVRILR